MFHFEPIAEDCPHAARDSYTTDALDSVTCAWCQAEAAVRYPWGVGAMPCDHDEACKCYSQGYADGKDKAYFEIRMMLEDGTHSTGCGCEPCNIIREVRARAQVRPDGPRPERLLIWDTPDGEMIERMGADY